MNSEQKNIGLESLKEDFENEARLFNSSKLKGDIEHDVKFEVLIETCQTSFSEMQIAIQDMLKLKDELLMHFLPPPLLFKLTVIFGKVFRSFSDLNTPVNEMLRLVKIYSTSWEKNSIVLKKIHDLYENKKQLLNLAIKRLAMGDKKTKLFAREKRVLNWEKLFLKLNESKGHGRRWRFQIDNFRKKSNLNYEELVICVLKESNDQLDENLKRGSKEFSKSNEKKFIDPDKKISEENLEKSNLCVEMDKSNFGEDPTKKINEENYINEVDSVQDFFSEESSEYGKKEKETKQVVDINIQTEPETFDKSIWTGEPSYNRYLILRLFKPTELYNKKIKFKITMGNISQYSKSFEIIKKVVIVDNKAQLRNNKSKNSRIEIEKNKEETERKIDLNKYEDFVFQVKDYSEKKEILCTSIDDSIGIELTGADENEDLFGYSLLQLDDVHTLDLPLLYHKEFLKDEIVDRVLETKEDLRNNDASKFLDSNELTEESFSSYEILSKRSPFTFEMYKTKTLKSGDSICMLPLMFFWVRKPNILNCNKNTNTKSIKDLIEDLTGLDIENQSKEEIQELSKPKSLHNIACSPIQIEPEYSSINKTPSSPTESRISLIHTEKLDEIHEEYQMKMDELKLVIYRLENEITKIKSLNELKPIEIIEKSKKKMNPQNPSQKKNPLQKSNEKKEICGENLISKKNDAKKQSLWSEKLQEGFYERLRQFNEKSYLHQKKMIEKYVSQEAAILEEQMAVLHRLDINNNNEKQLDDFCLPAVFMPFKSNNNVYNPRARQYFHASGTDVRITQPPSIFQLPPLPSRPTLSVINLYDLGKRYESGEPDFYINEYINSTAGKLLNQSKTGETKD